MAASPAKQIGIEDAVILTGLQMREMNDRAFFQQAVKADIFAEVEPNQKERIIVFFKKSVNVVGFMGDGINDAPALKVFLSLNRQPLLPEIIIVPLVTPKTFLLFIS